MKKFVFYCLFLVSPISVFGAGLAGTYRGNGHFGTIQISSRGPNYLLTTCGSYGNQCLQIAAELRQTADGQFISTIASLTAYYGSFRCDYPIRLQVTQDGTSLYLSEFGPNYFPLQARGCPDRSQLRYGSYVEPKPYALELN